MNEIIDPVTTQLEQFFLINGERLIANVMKTGAGSSFFFEPSGENTIDHEIEKIKKQRFFLENLIKPLCERQEFWRFLVVFRKLQTKNYELLKKILPGERLSKSVDSILEDSVFFGTNSILKFSNNNSSLFTCNDRYTFSPTRGEMEDAIRLMTLCILHRHTMFYNNTISHSYMQSGPSFVELLEIFNRRQQLGTNLLKENHSMNGSILLSAFAGHIPEQAKKISYKNRSGEELTLLLKNYYPFPINEELGFSKFSIVDAPEFSSLTGVTFEDWWRIWISLNKVAKSNLILYWSDNQIFNSKSLDFRAAGERTDDFCETGLGCGLTSTIINACHDFLKIQYGNKAPTLETCKRFVDYLSSDTLVGDPAFIEQPVLFYKLGPERVFWDYLRHGNVMNAVIRKLFIHPSKARDKLINKAAGNFEKQIKIKLEKSLKGVANCKLNTKITPKAGKRHVWEIDVGFVFRDILFLVEMKNWIKSEKYFLADDDTLSSRIPDVEAVLRKQDTNLVNYQTDVIRYWDQAAKGAICIVCTHDVEFTASIERKWWLKTGKYPRICLVDELISYLQSENLEELYSHPNFVPFDQ